MSEAPARAIPKSVTLARPSSSTITLWGLMSRCMTPLLVREAGGAQDLDDDVDRAVRRHRRLLADELLERAAVEELHRDVVGAVPLAAVEDADDVGVLEAGGRGGLAAEALDELLVLGEAAVEQLQRHPAAELLVLGAVDVGHAARAEAVEHPVAPVDDRVALDALHLTPPAPAGLPWRSARRSPRPSRPAPLDDHRDGHLVGEADEPRLVDALDVDLRRCRSCPPPGCPRARAAVPVPSSTTLLHHLRQLRRPCRPTSRARPPRAAARRSCGRRDRRPSRPGAAACARRRWPTSAPPSPSAAASPASSPWPIAMRPMSIRSEVGREQPAAALVDSPLGDHLAAG